LSELGRQPAPVSLSDSLSFNLHRPLPFHSPSFPSPLLASRSRCSTAAAATVLSSSAAAPARALRLLRRWGMFEARVEEEEEEEEER